MPNIHTVQQLSHPFGTNRLLPYVLPFLDDFFIKGSIDERVSNLKRNSNEFELSAGLYLAMQWNRSKENLTPHFEAVNLYNKLFREDITRFSNNKVVFLNAINICYDSVHRDNNIRTGIDDFCAQSIFPDSLFEIEERLGEESLKDYLFWRVGPLPLPYRIKNGSMIMETKDIVEEVNRFMESKDKQGLGSTLRIKKGEVKYKANYHFSPEFFDVKKVKKMYGKERIWEHDKLRIGPELKNYLEIATKVNLFLLKKMHQTIFREVDLNETILYSLNNSFTAKLVTDILPKTFTRNWINDISVNGEMEPSALGKLEGLLRIKIRDSTNNLPPAIIANTKKINMLEYKRCNKGIDIIECSIPCTSDNRKNCMAAHMSTIPNIDLLILDAHEQGYTIKAIESIIRELHYRNPSVELGNRFLSRWQSERDGRKILPLIIKGQEVKGDLRSSGQSSKCAISRLIGNNKYIFPFDIPNNKFSLIGTATHSASNEGDLIEKILLEEIGIEGIKREDYCEKGLYLDIKIRRDHKIWLEKELEKEIKLFKEYNVSILEHQKELISELGKYVRLSGHSDALLSMGKDVVVIDFKRSMKMQYEKLGFIEQMYSYGEGVCRMANLDADNIYLCLVKTPFTKRRWDPLPVTDDLQPQRYSIHKIKRKKESDLALSKGFILNFERKVIRSHLQHMVITRYPSDLLDLKDMKQNRNDCIDCFNYEDMTCDYLIEQARKGFSIKELNEK